VSNVHLLILKSKGNFLEFASKFTKTINCQLMRTTFTCLISLLLFSECNQESRENNGNRPEVRDYKVPDDSAITKAVQDAYSCISFKKGTTIDYDAIKNFFIPQARLINFRSDTAQDVDINQFIDLYKQFVLANNIQSFYEEELYGRTEQFGNIAERISSYSTYINTMDSVTERGVNSFQLIKTRGGWRVSSIIWDVEKPSLPIPQYYLK
jgi:hypothetical protein